MGWTNSVVFMKQYKHKELRRETQYLPDGDLWRSPGEDGGWHTLGDAKYPCLGESSGIRHTPS